MADHLSSVIEKVIERLYACSSNLNEQGQACTAGGCQITGTEWDVSCGFNFESPEHQ